MAKKNTNSMYKFVHCKVELIEMQVLLFLKMPKLKLLVKCCLQITDMT